MRHLEIPPTAETLREYIIPALFKHGKDTPAQKILEKLGSYTGIPLSQLVPAAMHHLLGERQYQQAINFGTLYSTIYEIESPSLFNIFIFLFSKQVSAEFQQHYASALSCGRVLFG